MNCRCLSKASWVGSSACSLLLVLAACDPNSPYCLQQRTSDYYGGSAGFLCDQVAHASSNGSECPEGGCTVFLPVVTNGSLPQNVLDAAKLFGFAGSPTTGTDEMTGATIYTWESGAPWSGSIWARTDRRDVYLKRDGILSVHVPSEVVDAAVARAAITCVAVWNGGASVPPGSMGDDLVANFLDAGGQDIEIGAYYVTGPSEDPRVAIRRIDVAPLPVEVQQLVNVFGFIGDPSVSFDPVFAQMSYSWDEGMWWRGSILYSAARHDAFIGQGWGGGTTHVPSEVVDAALSHHVLAWMSIVNTGPAMPPGSNGDDVIATFINQVGEEIEVRASYRTGPSEDLSVNLNATIVRPAPAVVSQAEALFGFNAANTVEVDFIYNFVAYAYPTGTPWHGSIFYSTRRHDAFVGQGNDLDLHVPSEVIDAALAHNAQACTYVENHGAQVPPGSAGDDVVVRFRDNQGRTLEVRAFYTVGPSENLSVTITAILLDGVRVGP